jgi:hypothetical protein
VNEGETVLGIFDGKYVGPNVVGISVGCNEGRFVGSNCSPRIVGTCVVNVIEGDIVVGIFDGKFVGSNVVWISVGCNEVRFVGIKVVG